jgi:hypothetical protein
MLNGKRIIAVLPAYNATKSLEMTSREIPSEIMNEVILVDDHPHLYRKHSAWQEAVSVPYRLPGF